VVKKFNVIYKSLFGTTLEKYESRHLILSGISSKCGFKLGNKNLLWHKDKEFLDVYLQLTEKDTKKK
jgi:hypothetical protein